MNKLIFEKAPHHIEYFQTQKDSAKYKAAVFGYPKLAAFADTANGYRDQADWSRSSNSKYFPNNEYPTDHAHARRMVEAFQFPADLRHQAHTLSRELVGAMEVEGAPKTLRNQVAGRFDPQAMKRVVKDLHSGKYSREHTRPYTMRQRIAPTPPHVAIVADGGAAAMWSSEDYIPRVATMMIGLTWACEAINCAMTTAIVRKSAASNQDFDIITYILHDDTIKTPLNSFAPLFHRDMYRGANLAVFASHVDTIALLNKGRDPGGYGFTTKDISTSGGGYGYSWAKSRGADIIIAIGDMDIVFDKDPAKAAKEKRCLIRVDTKTNLKDAVKQIADELIKIKYAREAA